MTYPLVDPVLTLTERAPDARREGSPVRAAVIRRLSDVVCWPESRISPHERNLAADLLLTLMRNAALEERTRCARGLARLTDAPKLLLRYLACDEIAVAAALLQEAQALDDADLIAIVRAAAPPHWLAIARRRPLSETVADAILQTNDLPAEAALLANDLARLSAGGTELLVRRARERPELILALARRREVTAAHAFTMFWWAGAEARSAILRRFAVDRAALIRELGDLFTAAAAEGWGDAEARKTLQVVERRQRSRPAVDRSRFASLEEAVAAAEAGLSPELLSELSHLAGVRPAVGARIFADLGGEPASVLCKACGLKREHHAMLWRAARTMRGGLAGVAARPPEGAVEAFESLSAARAQTVLRYWNWSLSAGVTLEDPAELESPAEAEALDDAQAFGVGRRGAGPANGWSV